MARRRLAAGQTVAEWLHHRRAAKSGGRPHAAAEPEAASAGRPADQARRRRRRMKQAARCRREHRRRSPRGPGACSSTRACCGRLRSPVTVHGTTGRPLPSRAAARRGARPSHVSGAVRGSSAKGSRRLTAGESARCLRWHRSKTPVSRYIRHRSSRTQFEDQGNGAWISTRWTHRAASASLSLASVGSASRPSTSARRPSASGSARPARSYTSGADGSG